MRESRTPVSRALAALVAVGGIYVVAVGCRSSCPRGATLRGASPPKGSAQWCEQGGRTIASVPMPGRAYDATLNIHAPTARGRLLEGPFTGWHDNGHVREHGRYRLVDGRRSVRDGVWTHWYEDGRVRSQGRYKDGAPVGCFVVWQRDGARKTLVPHGGKLMEAPCRAVEDREATALARRYLRLAARGGRPLAESPELFSASVAYLHTFNPWRVSAEGLTQPRVTMKENLRIAFRRRIRSVHLGLVGSYWGTDTSNNGAVSLGAVVSRRVPVWATRLHLDVAAEMGVRRYGAKAGFGGISADEQTSYFNVGYAGVELGLGYRLTRGIVLYSAAVGQVEQRRTVGRRHRFCSVLGCIRLGARWHVGGTQYGMIAGLRFVVR